MKKTVIILGIILTSIIVLLLIFFADREDYSRKAAIRELRQRGIHADLSSMRKKYEGHQQTPPFKIVGRDAPDFIHTPVIGLSATAFSDYPLKAPKNVAALYNFLRANQKFFEQVHSTDFSKAYLKNNFEKNNLVNAALYCGSLADAGRALSVKIEGDIQDKDPISAIRDLGDIVKCSVLLSAVPYTVANIALRTTIHSFCYSAERIISNFSLDPAVLREIRAMLAQEEKNVFISFDNTVVGAGFHLFGADPTIANQYISGVNSLRPFGRKKPADAREMKERYDFYRKNLFLANQGWNNFRNYASVADKWNELDVILNSEALRDDFNPAWLFRENLAQIINLKMLTIAAATQQYHWITEKYPNSINELTAKKLLTHEETINPLTGKLFNLKVTKGKYKVLSGYEGNQYYEKFEDRSQIEISGGQLSGNTFQLSLPFVMNNK